MNCLSCHLSPEDCQCFDELAVASTPATVVDGTVASDPERCSAIWIREDPKFGAPFLTVLLEPMSKATVDDIRLAVGALVRWRNAVRARAQRPFAEDDALFEILALHTEIVKLRGDNVRGMYAQLAGELNTRMAALLADYVRDLSIFDEAKNRIESNGSSSPTKEDDVSSMIRQIVVERQAAHQYEAARFHSLVGLPVATRYLMALGYSPDASEQIGKRAIDDIGLGREPFGPEYPADRRRMREVIRKALRKWGSTKPKRGSSTTPPDNPPSK